MICALLKTAQVDMYLVDSIDEPDLLVLKPADRFHCILHSSEIALAEGTIIVLISFVAL